MHGDEFLLQNAKLFHKVARRHKKRGSFIEVGSERASGSSLRLARLCAKYQLRFITIDPNVETYRAVQGLIRDVNQAGFAVNAEAEVWLKNYVTCDIVGCYMDGYDIVTDWPHKQETLDAYVARGRTVNNEDAWRAHLEATQALWPRLVPGAIVAYDDTWFDGEKWDGKGRTAIPWMLEQGAMELAREDQCAIFRTEEQ